MIEDFVDIDQILADCENFTEQNRRNVGRKGWVTNMPRKGRRFLEYESLMPRVKSAEENLRISLSKMIESNYTLILQSRELETKLLCSISSHLEFLNTFENTLNDAKSIFKKISNELIFIRNAIAFNQELIRLRIMFKGPSTPGILPRPSRTLIKGNSSYSDKVKGLSSDDELAYESDLENVELVSREDELKKCKEKLSNFIDELSEVKRKRLDTCEGIKVAHSILSRAFIDCEGDIPKNSNSVTTAATGYSNSKSINSSNSTASSNNNNSNSANGNRAGDVDNGSSNGNNDETEGMKGPERVKEDIFDDIESALKLVTDTDIKLRDLANDIMEVTRRLALLVQMRESIRELGELLEFVTPEATHHDGEREREKDRDSQNSTDEIVHTHDSSNVDNNQSHHTDSHSINTTSSGGGGGGGGGGGLGSSSGTAAVREKDKEAWLQRPRFTNPMSSRSLTGILSRESSNNNAISSTSNSSSSNNNSSNTMNSNTSNNNSNNSRSNRDSPSRFMNLKNQIVHSYSGETATSGAKPSHESKQAYESKSTFSSSSNSISSSSAMINNQNQQNNQLQVEDIQDNFNATYSSPSTSNSTGADSFSGDINDTLVMGSGGSGTGMWTRMRSSMRGMMSRRSSASTTTTTTTTTGSTNHTMNSSNNNVNDDILGCN